MVLQSPLAIANAPGSRRGVVVYRPAAQQRQAPAPTRRTNGPSRGAATRRTGQVDWNAVKQEVLSTETAQAFQQKKAQKEAEDEAYENTPMWGKGLGIVLGNPIARNVLKPLNALGTLGRGVVYGIEEAAEGMEDAPDWLKRVVSMTPAAPILNAVDTERTNADDRSFYEKVVSPDTSYGFGELLDPDNPVWANRIAGFVGDIGTDPLTYVTGGASRVVGAMGKASKVDDAARIATKADDLVAASAMAAKVGNPDEARRIAQLAGEQQALARRMAADAEALPNFKVPLRQGRRARESFVAELATENPQLLEGATGRQVVRGAERGFNTITDPALRQQLGLADPGLRFLGENIPGTAGIVRRGAQAGGVARAAMNRAPGLGAGMAKFTPRGLEEASGVLSRGKQGDVLQAATMVRIQNLMRRGAGQMESRGNRELTALARSWRKMDKGEIRARFRQAEVDDVPNEVNKFFGKLTNIYERVSGKKLDYLLEGDTYVPHMMTPQFKRFLRDNVDGKTVEDMGFYQDDLLEGSQYIEKSRKLKPAKRGEPSTFRLGDREITLNDGTIEELNEQLGSAFPEFKGKAYMDDPVVIGEAYISSIARQAGRDFALEQVAKSANPTVRKISGELLEAVETRNAYLRRNPIVEKVKEGYVKGQRLLPARPKGDMPTTPFDDMLASTLHVEATQAQRDTMMKEGKRYVSVVNKDVAETREGLSNTLKTLRSTLMDGLKKKQTSASNQIKTIDSMLNKMDDEIRKLGPLNTANVDEMVAIDVTVTQQIKDTRAAIKKIKDRYGRKIPRDQARHQRELEKALRRLEGQADDVRKQYAKGAYDMRKEAAERKEILEQPIRDAEQALEQAKAKHGTPPVSQAQVTEAESYLANMYRLDEAYEAERDTFVQALRTMVENNIPIYRRTNGRLTTESADMVQQVAAEIRKVEAPTPPAAAAGQPAAAALPPPRDVFDTSLTGHPEAPAPAPEAAAPEPPSGISFPTAAEEPRLQQLQEQKQGLENAYRDAVANNDENAAAEIEDQLDEIQEEIEVAKTTAAEPTPEEPLARPPLVKQPDGTYLAEDGYSIEKHGSRWHVVLGGEDRLDSFKTLAEATESVNSWRDILAADESTIPSEPVARATEEEVVEAATPPAPEPEAPAPPAERRRIGGISKKNKLSDGSNTYSVSDGVDYYTIRKNDDGQWIVRTNNEVAQADNGYRTLQKAGEAIDSGKHRAVTPTPAAERVRSAGPPPKQRPSTPTETAEPRPVAAKQRSPSGWKKEGDIEVGPDGWTVEPYQQAEPYVPDYMRTGYLERKAQGPRLPLEETTPRQAAEVRLYGDPAREIPSLQDRVYVASAAKPRKTTQAGKDLAAMREELADLKAKFAPGGEFHQADTGQPMRYLAIHPEDETLRGRSYGSARDAKLAVQELQRKRLHRITSEEYRAAGELRRAPVDPVRAYDWTGGRRTIEETPAPSPEEAAANRARAAAGGAGAKVPRRTATPPGVWEPTEEGAAVLKTRPEPREDAASVAKRAKYDKDYETWQELKRKAQDPALPEAERNKAARQARSLGGKFTQKQGEHYPRHAAEQVLIDHLDFENKMLKDEKVQAAIAKVEAEKAKADRQVEAMVYTRQHNPITGTDEYTRLPSGSEIGFGEDVERVHQAIEVPEQGEAITNTRPEMIPPPARTSRYSEGEKAADRALIESGMPVVMPYERQQEYDALTMQKQEIHDRLTNASRNEDELNRLKRAADEAYNSPEMRAADAAVAEAKTAKVRAEMNKNEGNIAGAAQAFLDAKRNLKTVVEAQTERRQAWMEADRAYKQALADRQAYYDVVNKVGTLEKAIFESATGEAGTDVVEALRRGELPKTGKLSKKTQGLAQELQRALIEQQEFDDAGLAFLSPAEHRNLAGQLIAIDESQRKLLNRVGDNVVKNLAEVLPRPENVITSLGREGRDLPGASGELGRSPNIPPVRGSGQDELAARAYAESFEPTQPKERTIWSLDEEDAPVARTEIAGRQPYEPRTEREALIDLEHAAQRVERGQENAPMRQQLDQIAEDMQHERRTAESNAAIDDLKNATERDEALLPLQQKVETLTSVKDALHNKAKLVPERNAAEAQRKVIVNTKVTGKKADLTRAVDDIGKVAKQNEDLLDDSLAVTEALLHDTRKTAQELIDKDLTTGQVQGVINKIGNKDDRSLDIMVTTVGRTWKMMYEANGTKKAFLQPDDIIMQADLHKMFQNLYEINKDKVLFGRTLNAFTNLFKTYATLTPGFHIRNAISAIFMNATDGVALKTQYRAAGLWRDYMKAADGEAWLAGQSRKIQDAFAAAHGSGAGGRFTEAGFASAMESGRWNDWMERLARNKVTRLSQRAGQRVEGSVRLAMALDSMNLGENVEAAVQRINRIHFDYGEISQLDETMKRLIPFWTFMSRNMPMQVSQMWTHPQVYLGYERFVNNMSSANEEYTPEYWSKAGAWNTGLKVPGLPERFGGGLPIYLSPDLGYTRLEADLKDYEDFLSWQRPGAVLSQGNPLITAPIEAATRTDIFTGQKFEEGETVPMGGPLGWPTKALATVAGQTKDGEVDAAFANFVRAINPLQDRSIRLAPQAAGSDPEAMKRQLESLARTGLGLPVRTLTPKQQDNEYFRRYYDQLDAEKLRRQRETRKAG